MNSHNRLAGFATRRASLLTFGTGGLAAITGFSLVAAGKNGKKKRRKKNRKKNGKQIEDRCPAQAEECNGFFAPLCAGVNVPEECREELGACCELLGDCQAAAFLDCFFGLLESTEPR